jgi:hypothetical protein
MAWAASPRKAPRSREPAFRLFDSRSQTSWAKAVGSSVWLPRSPAISPSAIWRTSR